jgi:hypothetical protein
MNEGQAKLDILWATANKFFPTWETKAGLTPDPWIIVSKDDIKLHVHVPRTVSLTEFEEETWLQFKKVKDDFELEQVSTDED